MSEPQFTSQGRVAVPGGDIWYGICGTLGDATPLLVIHGGPGMSHDYLSPLADLARDRPVIFYDQLDAGRSDCPNDPANWTVTRFLAEIDAVRAALSLTHVSVFGNSWGGTLAAAYAASNPKGLERVILSSPLIHTDTWVADGAALRAALPPAHLAVMDALEAEGRTDAPEYEAAVMKFYTRHLCRTDPWPPEVLRTLEGMNPTCYAAMWGPNEFTCTGVLKGYDGRPGLTQITAPTLVTCGQFDEATPNSTRALAALIPDATFEVFGASSHMAFIEERVAYIESLRRFLAAG
ncbi:proline iminopeptidase-family hydrolase [Rhodobacteraceae bacterium KMM 6894]|nr:proline iminopeptidase-family hydrolase [Rhodobacteraceae bacterium KMM 6894]